eukprot:7802504-Alexandrium_andersonii.AAC.1
MRQGRRTGGRRNRQGRRPRRGRRSRCAPPPGRDPSGKWRALGQDRGGRRASRSPCRSRSRCARSPARPTGARARLQLPRREGPRKAFQAGAGLRQASRLAGE